MKKKRYFSAALFLVLFAAATLLSGCGTQDKQDAALKGGDMAGGTGMMANDDTAPDEDQNEALELVVDSIDGETADDDPGLDELGL